MSGPVKYCLWTSAGQSESCCLDNFVKCLCCAVCVVQACLQVFPQRDALLIEKSPCNITCANLSSYADMCVPGRVKQM